MGAGGDLLQISAANTAGMDADENFARTNLRDGNGFQANVFFAVINSSMHGAGNGLRRGEFGFGNGGHRANAL